MESTTVAQEQAQALWATIHGNRIALYGSDEQGKGS